MNFIKDCKKRKEGFTLIELVVVIAVIGALLAMLVPRFSEVQLAKNMTKAKSDIRTISTALIQYESVHINGMLPTNLADLTTTLSKTDSQDGIDHTSFLPATKLKDGKFMDPWGGEYLYDPDTRTIAFTPKDLFNKELDPVTENF